ncbi:DNA helicase IV [Veronia pacifica]|uniref:DNA 3'-5' helicase n=1 Tax=Veronia pacifica TaxID=1080227 RepID=A0A1C3EPN3_9GAMM|nr:DNA helicase IV [Veronia pacifica]ODA35208.1 hypothetical protein A8L45_04660 [Veronia pacifica]
MKLTASPFAQWFVQGDHFSIAVGENCLKLESKKMFETVPFALWDGQCRIRRGIFWGELTLFVSPFDTQARIIRIHGLNWRKLETFAQSLAEHHRLWMDEQKILLKPILPQIDALLAELDDAPYYLRVDDVAQWQSRFHKVLTDYGVSFAVLNAVVPAIHQRALAWLEKPDQARTERNQAWLTETLSIWQPFFDTAESSPLNQSQRHAVLQDESHNLLLAGAGSGKTSVLTARARYLVASGQAQPSEILLLAFGKKAAEELKQRLGQPEMKGIQVATFHSFALETIRKLTGKAPDISHLASEDCSRSAFITLALSEQWQNKTQLNRWNKYFSEWPLPGVDRDGELVKQAHSEKLHQWIWRRLSLLLQQNESMTKVKQNIDSTDKQANAEFGLIAPLVKAYQDVLKKEGTTDFDGLIRQAAKLLQRKHGADVSGIRFIMVDEYQDISPLRMTMLEALCCAKKSRTPSLFAVGDDWQAIYRFTGADVCLTTDFSERFPDGNISYLDTTYRFNNMIGEVANRFVCQNPLQLEKPLNSIKTQKKKAVTVIGEGNEADIMADLSQRHQSASVLIIGRNNSHRPTQLADWQSRFSNLDIDYLTAHASKGREADFVFVVNVDQDVFPPRVRNEAMLDALLPQQDVIEDAEERRLFYVALTRAKEHVWLSCSPDRPSPFVCELIDECYPVLKKLAGLTKRKVQTVLQGEDVELASTNDG